MPLSIIYCWITNYPQRKMCCTHDSVGWLLSGLGLLMLLHPAGGWDRAGSYNLGFPPYGLAMKTAWASSQQGGLRVPRGGKQKLLIHWRLGLRPPRVLLLLHYWLIACPKASLDSKRDKQTPISWWEKLHAHHGWEVFLVTIFQATYHTLPES